MNDIAIKVENLSKIYKLYDNPIGRLKESLHPFRKKYHKDFYALNDVSFEIKKGETVGIIGKNGSGKSTLLKLITGVLTPSSGNAGVNGKISALLELGAGFNPEITGIENIYFNGVLIGYTKEEIDKKIDDMLSFADIGDFIYQPVKTYSSGMFVRLAFAVAISLEPDILVVDEALSVGDEAFQRKCFSRIQRIRENGGTILFVSHSAGTIVELCNWAILVDDGELILSGSPKMVVSNYHKLIYAGGEKAATVREKIKALNQSNVFNEGHLDVEKRDNVVEAVPKPTEVELFDPTLVSQSTVCYLSRGAHIQNPHITTLEGKKVNVLVRGNEYIYTYRVIFTDPAFMVRFGSMIKTVSGFELGGLLSHSLGDGIEYIEKGTVIEPKFRFRCILSSGVYFFNAGLVGLINGEETYLDRIVDAVMFRVFPESKLLQSGIIDFASNREFEENFFGNSLRDS
ncbi:MAG: ABC transporter ATP-binding protein [Deltaproteobacteria bacterium]|nr:ABC transporter ATP-binding protein [Deltaproteobacteria bacterium]